MLEKIKHNRVLSGILGMSLGSALYCFAIVFILDKGEFYAGGITGVSQIVANIAGLPYLKSIIIAGMNAPLFVIGWRYVSKRFAILSLASVLLQTALVALFTYFYELGFDPFKDLVHDVSDSNGNIFQSGTIVLSVIGGVICGIGCGLALRVGSSTGGTDIVSQAFSMKTGFPFAIISITLDVSIIVVGAIIGGSVSVAVYTIIRSVISTLTLDKIYTVYKYQKVTVITEKYEEMKNALIARFPHGITVFKATGAYTSSEKWVLESVALTYELEDYREIIKKIDPSAFVYYTAIKGILGKFVRKTL